MADSSPCAPSGRDGAPRYGRTPRRRSLPPISRTRPGDCTSSPRRGRRGLRRSARHGAAFSPVSGSLDDTETTYPARRGAYARTTRRETGLAISARPVLSGDRVLPTVSRRTGVAVTARRRRAQPSRILEWVSRVRARSTNRGSTASCLLAAVAIGLSDRPRDAGASQGRRSDGAYATAISAIDEKVTWPSPCSRCAWSQPRSHVGIVVHLARPSCTTESVLAHSSLREVDAGRLAQPISRAYFWKRSFPATASGRRACPRSDVKPSNGP